MSFNFSGLLAGLQHGLDAVEALMPVAQAMGAPTELISKVTNIAQATLETGQNVAARVEEGTIVATSQDQDQLKSILASLQAKNDELAAYIEAH